MCDLPLKHAQPTTGHTLLLTVINHQKLWEAFVPTSALQARILHDLSLMSARQRISSFVKRFYTVLTNSLSGQLIGETVAKTMMSGATPWPGLLSYELCKLLTWYLNLNLRSEPWSWTLEGAGMVTGPLSSSSPPRGHKEIFLYFLSLLLGLISRWVGKPSLLEAGVQTLPLKAPITTSQSLTHLKLKREEKK